MNDANVEAIPPAAQVGKEEYLPCLSLWQPWASAIPLGLKSIETRSWGRFYHGPLAIHASSRIMPEAKECDADLRKNADIAATLPALKDLPLGGIVCIARVVRIMMIPQDTPEWTEYRDASGHAQKVLVPPPPESAERKLGGYLNGGGEKRWAWILADVMPLNGIDFVPWKGMQGLFKIEGTTARDLRVKYRAWCLDQRPGCHFCGAKFGHPDTFRRGDGKHRPWEHKCPEKGEDWQNAAACFTDYSLCLPFLDGWIPEIGAPPDPTLDLSEDSTPAFVPAPVKEKKKAPSATLSLDI